MRMVKWAAAAGLMAMAQPALAQQPAAAAASPRSMEALAPELDGIFQRYMADAHVPGLVYGVVQGGRIVHLGTFGVQDDERRRPVTPRSLFRIASMSKAFTALAILKLRDEGRLSLDALAETYVPELRAWRYPTSDSPRIRVRDLLNHTGGFVTDDPWGDRQQPMSEADFTRMLRDGVPFTRAPGLQMEYSNFGYALLGRIVTNVSGRPYNRYIEAEIMRPLGMASSGYDVFAAPQERRALGYRWEDERWTREPDMAHGVFGAMGGVQTSAEDYARYAAWLLSAWPARDGAETGPLRRATIRELATGSNFASVRPLPGRGSADGCPMAVAYGMGFIAGSQCELGRVMFHGGGYPGYGSFLLLLPDHDTAIFAMANRTYAGPTPPVFAVAEALHRAGHLRGSRLPVSPALAAAYGAAGSIYRTGALTGQERVLAMNFLMDRSAEHWRRQLADMRGKVGECETAAPVTATGVLAGTFTWTCERGRIDGNLLLAPTATPQIQALRLNPVVNPAQ
ncbi:MAG TPA: serine hydrolase domain-containing protein [Allosphingosinicella sp.]|jgi:CubicO group peptidase (beta-lactamase class C family)|nr:serine hydrolase domain-containing protein [Allosphingosinicella sp.]